MLLLQLLNNIGVRIYSFPFIFFSLLFIFREKGREGEREERKHQCVVASHVALTGDLVCNPGMCPDWELNQQSFGSQPAINPLSYTPRAAFLLFSLPQL